MRILLSEGASTSAREAITALGMRGHHVEVCDPDPHCLARFSKLVRKVHRCPGLGVDPQGYLSFVLELISSRPFDVLLPIHEQGFLFAKVRDRVSPHAAIALPTFDSYERAHSKAGFSKILSDLGLPQPATRLVFSATDLMQEAQPPAAVKLAIGTASRGTWIVQDAEELRAVCAQIVEQNGFDHPVLVQDVVDGHLEHAQAVFAEGRLVAAHVYRQVVRGAGGGAAIKASVTRPGVHADLARIGSHLNWHGALSVDYILDEKGSAPSYIDCNPRLVEPMSAMFAGLDLVDVLLRVSLGEAPSDLPPSRERVQTHISIQALLGCALRSGSRASIARECWRLLAKQPPYGDSREELTPLRLDWPSFIPAAVTALWLLAKPGAAHYLPKAGWGAHLLTPQSIRAIKAMSGA